MLAKTLGLAAAAVVGLGLAACAPKSETTKKADYDGSAVEAQIAGRTFNHKNWSLFIGPDGRYSLLADLSVRYFPDYEAGAKTSRQLYARCAVNLNGTVEYADPALRYSRETPAAARLKLKFNSVSVAKADIDRRDLLPPDLMVMCRNFAAKILSNGGEEIEVAQLGSKFMTVYAPSLDFYNGKNYIYDSRPAGEDADGYAKNYDTQLVFVEQGASADLSAQLASILSGEFVATARIPNPSVPDDVLLTSTDGRSFVLSSASCNLAYTLQANWITADEDALKISITPQEIGTRRRAPLGQPTMCDRYNSAIYALGTAPLLLKISENTLPTTPGQVITFTLTYAGQFAPSLPSLSFFRH